MGKKYHATIQQFKKDGKYWYEIIADGESSFKIENEKPRSFDNVKLYASDPWHAPFSSNLGIINNVKITVPSIDVPGTYSHFLTIFVTIWPVRGRAHLITAM